MPSTEIFPSFIPFNRWVLPDPFTPVNTLKSRNSSDSRLWIEMDACLRVSLIIWFKLDRSKRATYAVPVIAKRCWNRKDTTNRSASWFDYFADFFCLVELMESSLGNEKGAAGVPRTLKRPGSRAYTSSWKIGQWFAIVVGSARTSFIAELSTNNSRTNENLLASKWKS